MSALFSPIRLRDLTLSNRIAISPMCMYCAHDGWPSLFHDQHLGKLAVGGAGCVIVEATAVERRGRGTPGDLGIWEDAQVPALRRLATLIEAGGSVAAIQIGHAGRKAAAQRPWHGYRPLGPEDAQLRGEWPWPAVAPSDTAVSEGWPSPHALAAEEIPAIVDAFRQGARRAREAGFRLVEVHMAHGYLLHSFLSPVSNTRTDRYGGDIGNRMRAPLEVVRAVREALGDGLALSVRISAVDGVEGGWTLDDSVVLARALADAGVDVIDCSSGGIAGSATNAASRIGVPRGPGFQVPFAEHLRRESGVPTIAVGLITEPEQAEAIIAQGRADIVAIGRQALVEPNWALQAALALGVDPDWHRWPPQYGWWLARRPAIASRR
jgi:2,4-dienoyl-CoA reductase-like NADH-dependent reductase (Old Yellow Enzyme family)